MCTFYIDYIFEFSSSQALKWHIMCSSLVLIKIDFAFKESFSVRITQIHHTCGSRVSRISWNFNHVKIRMFLDTSRNYCIGREDDASVNSKHQHSPGLTPGNFFKVVKFPAPGRKFLRNYGPGAKKIDKSSPLGTILWTFKTILPWSWNHLFWYSSLAWLSSSFFKDYKACEYRISQW